jgi:hypothetical protein
MLHFYFTKKSTWNIWYYIITQFIFNVSLNILCPIMMGLRDEKVLWFLLCLQWRKPDYKDHLHGSQALRMMHSYWFIPQRRWDFICTFEDEEPPGEILQGGAILFWVLRDRLRSNNATGKPYQQNVQITYTLCKALTNIIQKFKWILHNYFPK